MEHEVIVHQPQGGSAGTASPAQSTQDKVIVIETFNDLEGQIYIAYDTYRPNRSMHAKNQVNQCSG